MDYIGRENNEAVRFVLGGLTFVRSRAEARQETVRLMRIHLERQGLKISDQNLTAWNFVWRRFDPYRLIDRTNRSNIYKLEAKKVIALVKKNKPVPIFQSELAGLQFAASRRLQGAELTQYYSLTSLASHSYEFWRGEGQVWVTNRSAAIAAPVGGSDYVGGSQQQGPTPTPTPAPTPTPTPTPTPLRSRSIGEWSLRPIPHWRQYTVIKWPGISRRASH
jgi:hypothetical protein